MIVRHTRGTLHRLCRLAAVAACLGAAACGGREPVRTPWNEARLQSLSWRHKAAQLVVARAAPAPGDSALADSAVARLRALARDGLGGVALAGGSAGAARTLVDSLQASARLPLLVAAELGRGVGGTLAGATELPSPVRLGGDDPAELAAELARITAREARAVGITFGLVRGPAFPLGGEMPLEARNPRAAEVLGAWLGTLQEEGVLAALAALEPARPPAADTAADTVGIPAPRWDRASVEATQLPLLRAAVGKEVGALALGALALPALTGDSAPLPLSSDALHGLVRRDLGHAGLVAASLDPAGTLARRYGETRAAVAAVAAGVDLLLDVRDPAAVVAALVAAVDSGRIPRARLDAAVRNVFAAKTRAALGMPADTAAAAADARRPLRAAGDVEAAARTHERAVAVMGGQAGGMLRGCLRTVLVTPPGLDARTLAAELSRRAPATLHLVSPDVARRGALSRMAGYAGSGTECVVLVHAPGNRVALVDSAAPAPAPRRPAAAPPQRRDTAARRAGTDTANAASAVTRRFFEIGLLGDPGDVWPASRGAVLAAGAGPEAQRAAARALAGEVAQTLALQPGLVWPRARRLARARPDSAGMSADTLARIDAILRQAVSSGVMTAAVVAVGRHGRLVKLTGYGTTGGRPVDPEAMVFDIASLTKVAGTTPAVMALVEDGEVRLDAPVRRYLPQFRGEGKGDVTIRHLLTHTSGLPAGAWLYGTADSPEQALRQVMRASLVAKPGQRLIYSDFGMILLAEVVRRRAGEPLDRYVARRVFVPLGMESTMYLPPVELQPYTIPTALRSERDYVLDAVVHDGNAFRLGGEAGHAGLFSTAPDLAAYAQALLNGGAYGTMRLWSPGTVRAFTTRTNVPGRRGLGWDTPAPRSSAGSWFSSQSYGHTGFTGTSLWVDPLRGLFVVLLTNRTVDTGTAEQIYAVRVRVHDAAAKAITDIRPLSPRPGSPAAIEAERQRQKPKPRPRRPAPRRRRG